jgi:hypothetical protein
MALSDEDRRRIEEEEARLRIEADVRSRRSRQQFEEIARRSRQGFDLQLYDREGWRATFFAEGRAHSITQAVEKAYERTPAWAVQPAAWATLVKGEGARQLAGHARAPLGLC